MLCYMYVTCLVATFCHPFYVCVCVCVCIIVFSIFIPPTALVMERSVDRIARVCVLNVLQKGTLEIVQIKIA